ncbi:MAG: STAS domain-containing protein [Candidatus Omnitrophota bacterium]
MFYIDFDKTNNLLTLKISADFDETQAKQCLKDMENCLEEANSGVRILTDLTGLDRMDSAARKYFEQMMDVCNQKQPVEIVRIIPDKSKDIGFSIMSVFHYDKSVKIITCQSREEALTRLKI